MTGAGASIGSRPCRAALAVEQREVVGRVVDDDRDAGGEAARAAPAVISATTTAGRPPLAPRALGRDAVHGGRALGDLDSRIGQPVPASDHVARVVEHGDARRDDPAGLDVDARRLEIEDAEPRAPVGHALSVAAQTDTPARRSGWCGTGRRAIGVDWSVPRQRGSAAVRRVADVEPVEALGAEGEVELSVVADGRELAAAEEVEGGRARVVRHRDIAPRPGCARS